MPSSHLFRDFTIFRRCLFHANKHRDSHDQSKQGILSGMLCLCMQMAVNPNEWAKLSLKDSPRTCTLFSSLFRAQYRASTFLTCIISFKSPWISSFGICKLSDPSLPSENKTVDPAMAHTGFQEPVWMCSFNSLFGEIGHYHGEFMLLVLTKATNHDSIFLQRDILASTSPSWAHCLCQTSFQFLIPFLNKNIAE